MWNEGSGSEKIVFSFVMFCGCGWLQNQDQRLIANNQSSDFGQLSHFPIGLVLSPCARKLQESRAEETLLLLETLHAGATWAKKERDAGCLHRRVDSDASRVISDPNRSTYHSGA